MDVKNMDSIFDENANKENIQVLSANLEDNKIEESDLTKETTDAQDEMQQSDDMEDLASVLFYLNLASVSWHKQAPKKEPANQVPESEKPNTSALGDDDDIEKFLNDLYNTSDSFKSEEAQKEDQNGNFEEETLNISASTNEDSNNTDQTNEKPDYDDDFLLINFDEEISNDVLIEDNGVAHHYLL